MHVGTSDQFRAGLAEVRAEIADGLAEIRVEVASLDTRLSKEIVGVRPLL